MSTPRSHVSEPSPHPSATAASSLCLGRNFPRCLERDHCPGPNLLRDVGGHPSLPLWASEHPGKDSVPDPEITRKPGAFSGGLIPGARQWRLRPEVGQRKVAPSQLQAGQAGEGRMEASAHSRASAADAGDSRSGFYIGDNNKGFCRHWVSLSLQKQLWEWRWAKLHTASRFQLHSHIHPTNCPGGGVPLLLPFCRRGR